MIYHNACQLGHCLVFMSGVVISICRLLSNFRIIEIFKLFSDDAVDKLNDKEPNSDLLYGQRLKLAFKSYFKIMSILSVLAGFSLMVVSFTIYGSSSS